MNKEELLNAYTNVNAACRPLLKVLVSYIKPSFLFKTDVLVPLHAGRAVESETSKDGAILRADLDWLHKNCIGDDGFEGNISFENRRAGLLTGTYFAYKNYETVLLNPEYFGSFGYRRLLAPDFLSVLREYDAVLPEKAVFKCSLMEQFIKFHGKTCFKNLLKVFKKVHFDEAEEFDAYMELNEGYFCEIYVLKKGLFFDFCEWIFPVLFELLKMKDSEFRVFGPEKEQILANYKENFDFTCTSENFDEFFKRSIGFIMERVTGYYLYKLSRRADLRVKTSKIIYTEKETDEAKSRKYLLEILRERARCAG